MITIGMNESEQSRTVQGPGQESPGVNDKKRRLSGAELGAYRDKGFLIREGVFGDDEVRLLRDAVERAVQAACLLTREGETYFLDNKRFVDVDRMTVQFEHQAGSETIRVIEPAHHLDDSLGKLVGDPRVVEPVKDIIGCEEIAVWTNKLNLKRPREGSGFGWHQDSPYWIHDSDHVDLLPNVYLAFDDADEKNGCLGVVPGSHLQGCLPGTDDGTRLGGFFTDPACFREGDRVMLVIPAGSLVFFDPHLIHGSGPNRSDRPRRALIMTYQPAGYPMLKTGEVHNIRREPPAVI